MIGGGARMRLKPPNRTLVPRCCLLRQLPTTCVGAFFQRGGVRGCEGQGPNCYIIVI